MNKDKQKILDMIDQGTISAADGARLLECLGETEEKETERAQKTAQRMKGKKLRVTVNGMQEGKRINVNVSVPLVLARYADSILTNVVPASATKGLEEQGIDLRGLNISGLVDVFEELEEDIVNVDINEEENGTDMKVRIYVE